MTELVNVNVANFTGNIDRHPDQCPICHAKVIPTPIAATLRTASAGVEIAYVCPNRNCREMFIAYFDAPSRDLTDPVRSACRYRAARPVKPIELVFAKSIKDISPNFCEIYNEGHAAESFDLKQVCGVAYRKSIEFLIKDYLIKKHPDDAEAIKRALLGNCIENYITDHNIKQVSKRAVWLGNDRTHYERRWVNKDLADLKRMIQLVLHLIDAEYLTEEAIKSMHTRTVVGAQRYT